MKLLQLFTVTIFISTLNCRKIENYEKYTKVFCKSSNKTCPNVYCFIKPLSRTKTMMSLGCDLQRPLTNFKFNTKVWMQSLSGSFRYIMGVRDLDACHLLDHLENSPGLKNRVMYLNTSFPGLIHKCPYTSLIVANASPPVPEVIDMTVLHLPNGVYKSQWTISDIQDDNIAEITFFHEVFYHLNIFDFK